MTTNAGSEVSTSISGFSESKEEKSKEKTEKALFAFLRPEFINRIDEIITFRHLDKSDFVKIAAIMMNLLKDHIAEKGIRLTYSDEVLEYISEKSYSEKFGARNMRRFVERNVEDGIANTIIDNYGKQIIGIHFSMLNGSIKIDTM